MEILNFIDKELVFPMLQVKSRDELFAFMSGELNKKGYVKESYLEGLKKREKIFPTGLQLSDYGCALPHTEIKHVIKPAISIATLKESVSFGNMESPNSKIKVNVIFMLALNKSEHQLEALKQLVTLFQNQKVMNKIMKAKNNHELLNIISSYEDLLLSAK
ncbi:PTS sugar transporter subunit IIA [Garciella nitratireducens]|uniref:PTS sugar transporter subunit IIA n=1 Tax=Garciella nitratireducens TaxID=218205 RepID=UPI001BD1C02A|nr:PTS sugar transporter subunit IIA [Garciella nitratireducens]